MGDCSKWGEATDHDDFCVPKETLMKEDEESKDEQPAEIIVKDYQWHVKQHVIAQIAHSKWPIFPKARPLDKIHAQ